MILPDPNQSDIPIEVSPRTPVPPHPYFRQLAAIVSVFILTAGLGLAVKLAQQRQNPFSKAGGAIVANILISQHIIAKNWDGIVRYSDGRLDINDKSIGLSVQPIDSLGLNILYDPGIQWGMSSTNSVGNLNIHSSNRYAEFIPNGNEGMADIWVRIPDGNGSVIEKGVLAYVKGPYAPQEPQPTPTPTPDATPISTPLPSSACINLGGSWGDFDNYSVCQSADKTLLSYYACSQMNGIYNECYSSSCVAVCTITKPNSGNPSSNPFYPPLDNGCYYQNVQCIQAPCNPIVVCPTPTPTASPSSTLSQCNDMCSTNYDCPNNSVCINGSCRNPLCSSNTDCNCNNPISVPGTIQLKANVYCGSSGSNDTLGLTWTTLPGATHYYMDACVGKYCTNFTQIGDTTPYDGTFQSWSTAGIWTARGINNTFQIRADTPNSNSPFYSSVSVAMNNCTTILPSPSPTSSPVNHAPSIYTNYLPSANLDTDYDTTIEAYDDDGDVLTMTAITLPDGIRLTVCNQSNYPNTHLTCHLMGKTNSTIANTWSVKIEVKDSKGTITTKYLDLYVNPPHPTWVNWYNDSIRISGNIDLTVDGKKYKNMGLGASNVTDNSIDIYWLEHGFNNSVNIKFDHDDQYWWISNFDGKVGDKKINQIGQFYKTLLGRPFTIQNWELPNVKFEYFNVQAFANINFQPEFLTEELPAGRLFGWYTAAVSVEDQNLDDYNSMEFEILPAGLTLGTCATQNRQYPSTDSDENILHCLITGRPVSIGDHKLKAKIYDNNHNFVIEKEFTLPVRLFSSDPPSLPELIVSKTDYPTIFMPGKKATIVTEITNMGGSASDVFDPVVTPIENMIAVLNSQNTCSANIILNPGESCNLAYDVTYANPGPYEFILENLVSLPITVAPPGLIPMTITTTIPGQHNPGDTVMGKIRLMPGDGTEQNIETPFVYSADKNNFLAILTVPADWVGKNLTMAIKIPGKLAQRLSSSVVLDSEHENPIDATFLSAALSDFNNDNKFDISDIALVLAKYTKLTTAVDNNNQIYDINGDGLINIQDIALVLTKYTKLVTNGD